MPSVSPNPSSTAHSPRNNAGPDTTRTARPAMMRRQSSQSSQVLARQQQMTSPGSLGDGLNARHHVKPRHAKIVLPRNQSASGRNLVKLARQAQIVDDGRKHSRQRSHEGDTEIRLPGSLDESRPPPMRRNMTATQLPRSQSHVKLKKNLSHGQLTRLSSGKNLMGMTQKAPPSPGLKGRNKRPKSVEVVLLDREREDAQEEGAHVKDKKKGTARKAVGFAVGSDDDSSDFDEPQMEGSGLQEDDKDEWTEESASVSPYSTRQNTANNSRRASMNDRPPDKKPAVSSPLKEAPSTNIDEAHETELKAALEAVPALQAAPVTNTVSPEAFHPHKEPIPQTRPTQRSPLHLAKEHSNPTTLLLNKGHQLPAPALVSNISALDDHHSSRGSPATSMQSSRLTAGEASGEPEDPEELISRFVPGTSNGTPGSGGNTVASTPKQQSALQTPADERDNPMVGASRPASFHVGLASPGSTISGSSGAATPATAQSRTELRMAQEKAMADAELIGQRQPALPVYKYDRRNETLKTYLADWSIVSGDHGKAALTSQYGANRGTAIFQGRFRAVNTELRVVQKYRDPVGESIARLKACKGVKWPRHAQTTSPQKQATGALPTNRSASGLPLRQHSSLSKSSSPPERQSPLKRSSTTVQSQAPSRPPTQAGHVSFASGPERQKQRREVSFAEAPPMRREYEIDLSPDVIARQMWSGVDVE